MISDDRGIAEGHLAECEAENQRLRAALSELHHQAQRLWDADSGASLFEQAVDVWSDLIDAIEAAEPLVQAHHPTPQAGEQP
jgi:hypothetical protein